MSFNTVVSLFPSASSSASQTSFSQQEVKSAVESRSEVQSQTPIVLEQKEAASSKSPELALDTPDPSTGIKYGGFMQLRCLFFSPAILKVLSPGESILYLYLTYLAWRYPNKPGCVRAALPYLVKGLGMGIVYKLMVAVVYPYSVWVVSGPLVDSSIHKKGKIFFQQRSIQELESEITKKEAIRDLYWKLDRVTAARKYDLALEPLKEKLILARASMVEMPNLLVLQHQLWASIGFRVLVMVANFLCMHYLGAPFRSGLILKAS